MGGEEGSEHLRDHDKHVVRDPFVPPLGDDDFEATERRLVVDQRQPE